MKKLMMLFAAAALTFGLSSVASAQSANGALTVSATVNGSISLVFNSDAAGVALTSGGGTNAASLAFGNVSAFGPVAAGVTRTTAATTFTVSTPVDVLVKSFNSSSANYKLFAQLGSADAVNTWSVGGTGIGSATSTQITATGAYGSNTAEAIAITVPFTTASGTVINNTINFTATAN